MLEQPFGGRNQHIPKLSKRLVSLVLEMLPPLPDLCKNILGNIFFSRNERDSVHQSDKTGATSFTRPPVRASRRQPDMDKITLHVVRSWSVPIRANCAGEL